MDENYISTVLSKHPQVRNVFIHENSELLYIFGYVYNKLYVSKFNTRNGTISDAVHDFDGEALQHDDVIVRVFVDNGHYYGVDQSGRLFTFHHENTLDLNIEYDLFDDSPEKSEKWTIGNLKKIVQDTMVLEACRTKAGEVALLTSCERCVSLKLVELVSGELLKSLLIKEPGILHLEHKNACLMEWVSAERTVPAFFLSWFTEGREGDFLVVTLPDGCLLAVFPESGGIECFYVWHSAFVSCCWDFNSDSDSCGLRLVSECGAVLRLTESGELDSSFLPTPVRCAQLTSDRIYCSDWRDTYLHPPPVILPLKGIVSWAAWRSLILAFSRSGEVYAFENSFQMDDNIEELLPDSSLTAELIRKNAALEETNARVAEMDRYISAILISKKKIHFSLSAQMLYVGRNEQSLCLVMRCLTEGMEISQKDWLLALMVQGQTTTDRLRADLGSEPLLQVFRLNLQPSARLSLSATLFFSCLPSSSSFLPVIPVGKVVMGPSYFLLPGIELKTEYVPPEPNLESLFRGASGSAPLKPREEEREDVKLSVKLSEDYPEEAVFRNLLNDSKALWRTSLWDSSCRAKKLELAILNKLVTVEVAGREVTISGDDLPSCFLIKEALFSTAPTGSRLRLEPPLLATHLESLIASSEVLASMDKPPIEKVEELRRLLRENITSSLTP